MKRVANNIRQSKTANPSLKTVADAFFELQQARHDADYNNGMIWTRLDVSSLITQAETAFVEWGAVRDQDEAQDFLLTMLVDRK